MYAILQAIAKWRQYLLGRKFTIYTDQQALKNLQTQVIQTPEQQKWLSKLLGYDFDILYRPGKSNAAADALSRISSSQFFAYSRQDFCFINELRVANKQHPELLKLHQQLENDPKSLTDYVVRDGLLFFRDRLVVPSDSNLRQQLLLEFHSSPIGGHSGVHRTFHRLASNFFWPYMLRDVQQFVAECHTCQQMKSSSLPPSGLLQPLPLPSLVFEGISMDFITGLPPLQGRTVIMVVIDRLSKYAHFIPLPTHFNSAIVASAFVSDIVRLHGIPAEIVSDRDSRFMTDFWRELHRLQGTTLAMSTAYHPQTDGQTEALNRCLEMYLRCYVSDCPKTWLSMLPWAEYWYNTSFQSSAQMTPFEVLYGRTPPTIVRYLRDSTGHSFLDAFMLQRDEVLQTLKVNLLKAQARMKNLADQHRRDIVFEVGDWVYIKLQPYRQNSLRLHRHHKLGRRYFGPYKILRRIGSVAYHLELPSSTHIHPVFHVSLLRKCVGVPDQQVTPLHLVDSTATIVLQPAAIVSARTVTHQGQSIKQCLVRWEGLTADADTWEDKDLLLQSFPTLNLEDKVLAKGESIVMAEAKEPKHKSGQAPAARSSSRIKRLPERFTNYVLNPRQLK
ncbi:hypothetical protein GQ457_16G014550 [Hibiscus cannabinus]